MAGRSDFAEATVSGLRLHVRLTPRSGADRIDGAGEVAGSGPVLLARVRAVPEKGLANAALIRLLAEAAGWPRSALSLDKGSKSRVKVVEVAGERADLAKGLTQLKSFGPGAR